MKEIGEAWQMRIFDLLEGNLSPKESADTLKEIEANPALLAEYKLMQLTYLEAENESYDFKSALYHKPAGLLSVVYLKKYAAAAAIAILFGSIAVFYFQTRNQGNQVAGMPQHNQSKTNTVPANKQQSILQSPGQPQLQAKANPVIANPEQKKQQQPYLQKPPVRFDNTHIADPEFIAVMSEPVTPGKMDLPDVQGIKAEPVLPEVSTMAQLDFPTSYKTKRTLHYKLTNQSKTMLASLQLPKIQFKTEKKPNKIVPRLKMEISTPKTDIIATLID